MILLGIYNDHRYNYVVNNYFRILKREESVHYSSNRDESGGK